MSTCFSALSLSLPEVGDMRSVITLCFLVVPIFMEGDVKAVLGSAREMVGHYTGYMHRSGRTM